MSVPRVTLFHCKIRVPSKENSTRVTNVNTFINEMCYFYQSFSHCHIISALFALLVDRDIANLAFHNSQVFL